MKTLSKTKTNQGLTLIEIIIVIAILAVIISLGAIVDLNAFKNNTLQAEESKIVSLLSRARSRAMANMFDTAHGVCYIAPNYVIFQENVGPCASSNELIPANINIASHPSTIFPTVVFDRLTGTTAGVAIHITDGLQSEDIEINEAGTINW